MYWSEKDLENLISQGKVSIHKENSHKKNTITPKTKVTTNNSKYHNKKTVVDEIKFDSEKEANYYKKLKLQEMAGEVKKIELQVPFVLQEGFTYQKKKERSITYLCDFRVEYKDGHIEIVDVKGFKTDVYKLKRKLLLHKFLLENKNVVFKEV